MQHSEFVVDTDGFLRDKRASEQAAWYVERSADLDPTAMEAQIMLTKAYSAISSNDSFGKHRGLTKARFSLLRMLAGAPDLRLPMTELVVTMNVSPTNITKLVDGLERDGYVRRVGNSEDKRRLWIEILPEGVEAVEEAYPDVIQQVIDNWAGFKQEDLRALIHLLAKLQLDILTLQTRRHLEVAASAAG